MVVIGRADVTDVEVRGKTFSLAGIVKDNVARFEVK
jgi:cytoskeleton protein RodZ